KSLRPCNVCGEGHLSPNDVWDAVEYKSQHGKIRHYFSVCDVCGVEVADATQTLENKREWVRFRKQVDGVPLGEEIVKMRQRHKLTQAMAGQLFGGGPVAFSKYEHDDFLPDEAMTNLLYLAIHYPETVSWLAARKKILIPKVGHAREVFLHVSLEDESHDNIFEMVDDCIVKLKTPYPDTFAKKKSLSVVKSSATFDSGLTNGEQSWHLQ
ncbi:MAG: type II toxin-antitoxin system MqsA family antitoxin, partial [Sulfurimicrobium sp.]|nr:type II toxin-antitoxin system MqsA family antitoxin [Sulfurimicrobium sp.]